MSTFPDSVEICEVGPRDGLQTEDPLPVDVAQDLIGRALPGQRSGPRLPPQAVGSA
ncbi:MAG TPA: hypothetical protein VGN59_00510 [Acidimicrobiia bacterium]|jgi:hypothetical protein